MPPAPLLIALATLGPPALGAEGEAIRARYEVDLVGRSRIIFALPAGPRTIRGFRWIPDPEAPDAWRSARLRLVWDGDDPERAGVDLPLGHFVAPADDDPSADATPRYINRRPMPYRRLGRLVIDAEGPVRGSIRLDTLPGAPILEARGYLRAAIDPDGDPSRAEPPPNRGHFPENPPGRPGPPVRYWYDRRPGPASEPDSD